MTIQSTHIKSKRIFITGGSWNEAFIKYIVSLTGKERPTFCYLPTAVGDDASVILRHFERCNAAGVHPTVLKTFISSFKAEKTFEEILMNADVIQVSGGNTLNMMAIWRAQGIDKLLQKAYDSGIIMCGASAGSLCWFDSGLSDSRPKELSIVKCLGILPGSHCPHYHNEPGRDSNYQAEILKGNLPAGYACDNGAGLLFENGKHSMTVVSNDKSSAYYVSGEAGEIVEKKLPVDLRIGDAEKSSNL